MSIATGRLALVAGLTFLLLQYLKPVCAKQDVVSQERRAVRHLKKKSGQNVQADVAELVKREASSYLIPADSKTAYEYQIKFFKYFEQVDNLANDPPDDVDVFYMTNVASRQTPDIIWDVDAGARKFKKYGTDEVLGLFQSFATRRFAFHEWNNYEVFYNTNTTKANSVEVHARYHATTLEAEGNYQDLYGLARMHFLGDSGLIDYLFVQRFYGIDRGYSAPAQNTTA